ncbi:HEAT repeat domain-containing protein [bacterium]|nr:HEAT repeat domain-containing protein [bacterium]
MSNPHINEEQLFLYLIHELSFQEMADIEYHLDRCDECRIRSMQMKQWLGLFHQESLYHTENESLIRARNRFKALLGKQAAKKRTQFFEAILSRIPSRIETKRLVTAMCFLIAGIFVGHYFWPIGFRASNRALLTELASASAGSFRIIPSETHPDRIEIRFLNQNEKRIQGEIQDPDIQTLLAYALMTDERDNLRLRSMDMIQTVSHNETVEEALLHTLANDPNPGLRYRAIKLLKHFPINDKMKSLLIRVLFQDTNPGIRIQVTEKLIQSNDPEIQSILEKRAEKDEYIQYVLDAEKSRQALNVRRE